ncbi:MAG: FAD-binding oxidoreductase [Burkholderiales bacterium]|nr:FAD-binding oxidoreductase [Burkholderiales bacterium]OJX06919.1 MAG: 4-cresol dehydrogenase [Burkholderiales bacterium 70-64]
MSSKRNVLPRGTPAAAFEKALEELRAIVGREYVLDDAERLAPYNKIMMPVPDAQHAPSAAIMPADVEQIQQVMKVLNRHKVPVYTVSTGKNLGYGSAAPVQRGQVVMDLRRMNRILSVDPDLCTALVEPGVTYQQLYDYLQEKKLPLWFSCPAPSAIAGPLGNAVDRGVGYTPYGEHFMFSCGMEVVLANGEVLRTGMGAMPNSNTWQVFKWGYGPTLDGLFTQSNYGIVTKLGMWLMPAPPDFRPFCIQYPDESDINKIVDALRPLRIAMIIPNAVVIAHTLWEAPCTPVKRADYHTGPGAIGDDAVRRIQKDHGIGAWNVYAALYGTKETNDANWKIVEAVAAATGGRIVTAEQARGSKALEYRFDLMKGKPNLGEFGLYNWRGGGGSIWFAPVSQAKGSETHKQMQMAKRILAKYGFDYVGEFIVGWRDMHHVIDLLYDRTDEAQTKQAYACYDELLHAFAKEGYGLYRANTAFAEKVAATYGPVKRSVEKRLKKALDPNNIIAPGRCGISL